MAIDEDVLERLEAEAKVAEAEAEELTIAVESDVKQKEEKVEELESQVHEKEQKVEELESQVEDKESEIEELQDEVDTVSEMYAEKIAEDSAVFEEEELQERYDVGELREKYESIDEESDSEPNPGSGDPGPNVQEPEGGEGGEEVPEDLSQAEEMAADAFEQRASAGKDYWGDIAEEMRGE